MPIFQYKARVQGGELRQGKVDAPDAEAVADQLLSGGMTPIEISEAKEKSDPLESLRQRLQAFESVPFDDLILFARQMYSLTKAGVPILRALKGLATTSRTPAMGRVLGEVCDDLESGRNLSGALGRHPKVFPALFGSMVQVGENTGRLEEVFDQIAGYLQQEKEIADRVKAALRYPTFVTIAIGVAIGFISLFVIPTFEKVFKGFGSELPLPTKIIMGISHFAVSYWPYILVAMVLTFFGLKRYINTKSGRMRWDSLKLRLPLVGSIIQRATLTRFSNAFAMSFGAGVPLVTALGLTAQAVDNMYVATKLNEIRNGIERGDTLTRSAAATGLFTPLVLQMLSVGEETGAVDEMLREVADFYEREVDYDLKKLSSAIEPILIVVIGGMVLVLALGVFLPMWNLSSMAR